jgi:peptidoglycan hydrolase-like protein with peptidoglycan-binding domain
MSVTSTSRSKSRRFAVAAACSTLLVLLPVAGLGPAATVHAETNVSGLAQGARGDAVRAVQQALVNQGVAVKGGVDGVFGAATASALKQFQTAKGLSATGVVDDATALALGLASSPLLGLTQGNKGDAVKLLQQKLIGAGINVPGGADGVFGAATTAALKQFQTAKGYLATGSVNEATAAALGGVTSSTPTTPPSGNAGSGANPLVGLKIGARGDAVKQLQQQLMAAGFDVVGGADGVFGVLTAQALSSFQKSAGLPSNGRADEATVTALAAAQGGGGGGGGGGAPPASSPLLGLKLGSSGDAVKQLQQALIAAGVSVRGGADGSFGPATQSALTQYQQAAGIAASGEVDQATASALASGQPVNGGNGGNGGTPTGLAGLKAGSLGDAVKQLQQQLIAAGITVRGGADGIFGPATAQALKAFQNAQGLQATGVVDDATVAALKNPKPTTQTPIPSGSTGEGYAVFGERGTRVVALQSALVQAGVTVRGGVDGDFGPSTTAAVMDFQRAKGLPITGKVSDATAAALNLAKAPAPVAPDPSAAQFSVFPVQGRCSFGDSFGFVRSGGRAHLGVDIIAPAGKLLYAVADGKITKIYGDYPGSLSGNGIQLTTADGTYYFYAHMTGIGEGIALGVPVKAGQIVGTVGATGNAGTNHLHFEVHPKGGAAINPYPLVKAIDACNVTDPRPQP